MKKFIAFAFLLLSIIIGSTQTSRLEAAPAAADSKSGSEKKEGSTKKGKKVAKKKGSGKADYSPLNFTPFGIPQFTQGRPLMGGALGGGQVLMLYIYMDRKKQVTASNNDANATIAEINANSGTPDEDTLAYLDRNAAYVKKTNSEASMALLGFVGLYAISVVDAVWDPLGFRKAAAAKSAAIEEMDDGAEKWAEEKKLEKLQSGPRLGMFALPKTQMSDKTFGISLQTSFR